MMLSSLLNQQGNERWTTSKCVWDSCSLRQDCIWRDERRIILYPPFSCLCYCTRILVRVKYHRVRHSLLWDTYPTCRGESRKNALKSLNISSCKKRKCNVFFYFAVTYLMAKHHSKRTNESDLITRTEKPVTLDKDMWRDKNKDKKEEERLCLEETLTMVDTRKLVFQARADEAFAENVTGLCTSRRWWSKKNLEVWA